MKLLITVPELRKLMPDLTENMALLFVPHLDAAMRERGIISKKRRCAFLPNLAHESSQLTRWFENLNYSPTRLLEVFPTYFTLSLALRYAHKPQMIASRVYANRMGNGPEDSGDGWRYRGRGPIQLTGQENYAVFSKVIGVDLIADPDLAARAEYGFRIAAAFWERRGCNELADELNLQGNAADRAVLATICKRINGGLNGLSDRINYYRVAKQTLHNDNEDPPSPLSPAIQRPAESVAEQESADREESPATVSTDTDVDLLGAAVVSDRTAKLSKTFWAKHGSAATAWVYAMYEANQYGTIIILIVIVAGIAWLVYHNRAKVKGYVVKWMK